jgi:uncharacterized protein YunC (DUF1805 family)
MMTKLSKYLLITGLILLLAPTLSACNIGSPPVCCPSPSSEENSTTPAGEGKFIHQRVKLINKDADGYVIPIGKANIVCVITDIGMAGCGAFDVLALDSFTYPAVKVKSSTGGSIATVDDLLNGTVKEVNKEAAKFGIKVGMTGREALDLL